MNNKIVGRVSELQELKDAFLSNKAEFIALYGRRRIGKTYLVHNYFSKQKCIYFHAVGLQKGTLKNQLKNFTDAISETFYDNEPIQAANSWLEAFARLTKSIDSFNEKNKAKNKIILFLDELPWMVTQKSGFLEALDYYWNRNWSNNSNIKLIVCGSSASWIIRKIIYNKGGLHNRVTRQIILKPFSLCEVQEYLNSMACKYTHNQILELYMAMGGIPFYLNGIRKNLSAMQNIDHLFFNKEGLLFDEFDKLFSSLFKEAKSYIEIIRIIAQARYGISRSELEKKCKLSEAGGSFSEKLKALEDTGFILSFLPFEHQKKGLYYKVIDEYSLFYLQWIEPKRKDAFIKIEQGLSFWESHYKTPAWYSWAGYAFEAICYKHLFIIRKVLNIPAGSRSATWKYHVRNKEEDGAQIDLLFDREDQACTLCEIKYTDEPYVLTKEQAKNLQNKERVFIKETKTNKQIFFSMITANGIKQNMYSEELITSVVSGQDFFTKNKRKA
ncbi:MAG: AAA family ATPase, partial [Gammaproteobacteria bacterium]